MTPDLAAILADRADSDIVPMTVGQLRAALGEPSTDRRARERDTLAARQRYIEGELRSAVRTTRKWIDVAIPVCPVDDEEMVVESKEDEG